MNIVRGLAATTILMLGAEISAQGGLVPVQPPQPVTQDPLKPWGPGVLNEEMEPPVTGDPELDALTPIWARSPSQRPFKGFPTFPSKLPGYGRYPMSLGDVFRQTPLETGQPLPVAPAPPPVGWPSWLKLQSRQPLPYEPGLALLVQGLNRVWWRAEDEGVFVPLSSYDKLRPVAPGAEVEVRSAGQFVVNLYGGSRLMAAGPTRLKVVEMNESIVRLDLSQVTKARMKAFGREHRLQLPDGSTIVMAKSTEPPPPAAALLFGLAPSSSTPKSALVHIERADQPGWRGGRATVWNGGGVDLEWQHALGNTTIAPGQRVTLLLEPVTDAVGAALENTDGTMEPTGDGMRCRMAPGGAVSWCGARFTLGADAVLELQPGQGRPFAAPGTDGP